MEILEYLNPQQRLAVEHKSGPALVLAGAGSGKTRVIAHRIAYMINSGVSRPENILAVTFTNKAAGEMRDRVHALLGAGRSAEPLICTFHSLCVRILRREIHQLGYRRDFSIYDADDQKKLIKQIIRDRGKSEADLSSREILSRISYAKNHNIKPEAYVHRFSSPIAEEIQEMYGIYNERLRSSNALDFDDLLSHAVRVLKMHPDRREFYCRQFRFMLVDEYQDTNRPQYDLMQLLAGRHKNVFVVGDEDQSIYKFRGADIGNILNFEKDFPGAKVIKLEQNYRSTQNILTVASSVVKNNVDRKGKVLWTENGAGDFVSCHRFRSARLEASWVANEIETLATEDPDQRIAILYRANFLSRNFEDALLERGVPYSVVGGISFFSRAEIKDMLAYLRIIYNPEDDIALLRIINTPPRGIGSTTINLITRIALERRIPLMHAVKALLNGELTAGRAQKVLKNFVNKVEGWSVQIDKSSMAEMLEQILEDTEYKAMLERQGTSEESANRYSNIEELMRAAIESQERGETTFEFLDRASLSSELDRLDPNAGTALMTLHTAKGLEFDFVFLAGMEEGLFPHALSSNSAQDLEEERRLCYVGITRARGKLYLTWTPFRRSFGPNADTPSLPSRFLMEMPQDLIEGLDLDPEYIYDESEDYGLGRHTSMQGEVDSKIGRAKQREEGTYPKTIAQLKEYLEQVKKSSSDKSAHATPTIMVGMRVRHPKFGDGIVLRREKSGKDIKLTVSFVEYGKKTLMQKYAKLEALNK